MLFRSRGNSQESNNVQRLIVVPQVDPVARVRTAKCQLPLRLPEELAHLLCGESSLQIHTDSSRWHDSSSSHSQISSAASVQLIPGGPLLSASAPPPPSQLYPSATPAQVHNAPFAQEKVVDWVRKGAQLFARVENGARWAHGG